MIGQTVSHYRILAKLGEGGMGVVYKAEHLKLGSFVALKFLSRHIGAPQQSEARFIHEAKAASSLEHPNIGSVYDIGQTSDGLMYIVMPYYAGETLQAKIERGPLELAATLDIVSHIASGLAKAHEKGIVHRDIKPGNILVTEDGHPKILDFGLAKLAGQTRVTRTGTTVGTVAYMSPEQVRGEAVDARSDVFSLGVVLYELLTGKQPFGGDQEAAIIYSIMNLEPEPLRNHRPDLPPAMQNLLDKALAKDPATRYENAVAMLGDLELVKRGQEIAAVKRRRRGFTMRSVRAAALGAAVVAVAFLLYLRWGPRPADQQPALSPNLVAVFPFTVQGGEAVAYLGEGIVDLLSMKLNGVEKLQSVDPAILMDIVRQNVSSGDLDPERARVIAGQTGAGRYITGSILETGGQLSLRASIFRTADGTAVATEAAAEGHLSEFRDLVDDLAADLVVALFDQVIPIVQMARQATASYPALVA